MITCKLLGLEHVVPVVTTVSWHTPIFSAVLPAVATGGWKLETPVPQQLFDVLRRAPDPDRDNEPMVFRLYLAADPDATGRVTVPCLFDTQQCRIINNESADIIRLLNGPLRSLSKYEPSYDLRPAAVDASELDAVNELVYLVNNGVYKCGFSGSQEAYLESKRVVFTALERISQRLDTAGPFLMGDKITEADIRAFTTLVRFDIAYFHFFRVNDVTLRSGFPVIHDYLLRLLAIPEFSDTVDMLAYVTMYGIICKYRGQVAGNLTRWMIVITHLILQAARPDAASWRRKLAAVVSTPWWVLSNIPGFK